jgi:error-prone DNA polymerase
MADRYVVQWDKDSLEDAGIVKIDILGLRMLSATAEAVAIIQQTTGKTIDLDQLIFDDPQVYAMIARADTLGVFQVESRAQMQVLPRLKPARFEDLIITISLIRPGPVQGNMVHPYLRRRLKVEDVAYPHESLIPALKETLGVILFQEQVLKVARDFAGFTAGQGELLRRALGSKDATQAIREFHDDFITGAKRKGVSESIAEDVFEKLTAFGGYSFAKSHAASFATLVYKSAWLKHYYPLAFYIGLLNNQPMGFYSPAVVVNDAKRHDITIRRHDVNCSFYTCVPEDGAIRLGFNYVSGFGELTGERVVEARGDKPFRSIDDFCQRTRLPRRLIEHLILVGAMDEWGERRQLIWRLGQLDYRPDTLELVYPDAKINLPKMSEGEALSVEFQMTGVALHIHPIEPYREWLTKRRILNSDQLERCPAKRKVQVAGALVVKQAPETAKGFRFITLEDEFGFMNVIVRPKIYPKFRRILRPGKLVMVEGEVQREGVVTNLLLETAKLLEDAKPIARL